MLRTTDWEFASFGDPLSDVASHLKKIAYGRADTYEPAHRWAKAVGPEHVRGYQRDLEEYRVLHNVRWQLGAVGGGAAQVRADERR